MKEIGIDTEDSWQIQNPKGKSIREVREIRDQIEQKVKDFIDSVTER